MLPSTFLQKKNNTLTRVNMVSKSVTIPKSTLPKPPSKSSLSVTLKPNSSNLKFESMSSKKLGGMNPSDLSVNALRTLFPRKNHSENNKQSTTLEPKDRKSNYPDMKYSSFKNGNINENGMYYFTNKVVKISFSYPSPEFINEIHPSIYSKFLLFNEKSKSLIQSPKDFGDSSHLLFTNYPSKEGFIGYGDEHYKKFDSYEFTFLQVVCYCKFNDNGAVVDSDKQNVDPEMISKDIPYTFLYLPSIIKDLTRDVMSKVVIQEGYNHLKNPFFINDSDCRYFHLYNILNEKWIDKNHSKMGLNFEIYQKLDIHCINKESEEVSSKKENTKDTQVEGNLNEITLENTIRNEENVTQLERKLEPMEGEENTSNDIPYEAPGNQENHIDIEDFIDMDF